MCVMVVAMMEMRQHQKKHTGTAASGQYVNAAASSDILDATHRDFRSHIRLRHFRPKSDQAQRKTAPPCGRGSIVAAERRRPRPGTNLTALLAFLLRFLRGLLGCL